MPSLKHPKWIKKKQVAQLCPTPHLVAISWLSLKFVCLFHISIFLWILKIHVAFDVLCSCIYLKKNQKKKKKSLWTRGIEPLSHLKKKFFELGALDFLVTFFKKCPFFFFQRFQDSLKSSFQNGTWGSLEQIFFLNCGV